MVTPRTVPEMMARTPSVVVVIWLVVVGVSTRLAIYAFFDVHPGRYVVVVVMRSVVSADAQQLTDGRRATARYPGACVISCTAE